MSKIYGHVEHSAKCHTQSFFSRDSECNTYRITLTCEQKTNMQSEGSGNDTGLAFENRIRTQSRTCSPI